MYGLNIKYNSSYTSNRQYVYEGIQKSLSRSIYDFLQVLVQVPVTRASLQGYEYL
jgi:hypothetical protein